MEENKNPTYDQMVRRANLSHRIHLLLLKSLLKETSVQILKLKPKKMLDEFET